MFQGTRGVVEARLGAFEVSAVWLAGPNVLRHVVIYSKLQVGFTGFTGSKVQILTQCDATCRHL